MSDSFAQFCVNYDDKADIKAESLNETIKMLQLELQECNNNLTLSKKKNEEPPVVSTIDKPKPDPPVFFLVVKTYWERKIKKEKN